MDEQQRPEQDSQSDEELAEQIEDMVGEDAQAEKMLERLRGRAEKIDMEGAKDLPTASLEDLKRLQEKRVEEAVPFPIRSLGMKVMVGRCAYSTYHEILSDMFEADDQNMGTASAKLQGKILQACIIEPELDDENVQALMNAAGDDVLPLIGFCRRFSGIDSSNELMMTGVEAAEDFTRSAR